MWLCCCSTEHDEESLIQVFNYYWFFRVLIRVGENNIAKVMNCQNEGCAPLVQDREPLKLIVHPKYYPWKNDIALIQLDRDVVYHSKCLH